MNLPIAFIFWAVMVGAAIGNDIFAKTFLEKFTGAYGVHLYKVCPYALKIPIGKIRGGIQDRGRTHLVSGACLRGHYAALKRLFYGKGLSGVFRLNG